MSIVPSKQRDRWRRTLAPILFLAVAAIYLHSPVARVPADESLRLLSCANGWEPCRTGDSPLWMALARTALALPWGGSAVQRLIVLSGLSAAGAVALVFLTIGSYIHNRTPEELFHEPYPALMSLLPAAVTSIALALCRPVWDAATSVSAEPLGLLLFALSAWLLTACRVSSRSRYLFLAGLAYGLGASSSRILLFSAPLFLVFLTAGVRIRWWRGIPGAALGAGFVLGAAVWAVPALAGGSAFGETAAANIRRWTFMGPGSESAVVQVSVPDPMNPGQRMTRVTFVPADAVGDAPLGARLGGATLFFAGLLPLVLVSWNWRRDIKRDRSPRDTQVGSILRRTLFSILFVGGILLFARSGAVVAAGVGPESYVAHVYLVAALWLAYLIGYWLIVLGAPPARYRRRTVPRIRVQAGRAVVLTAVVLLVGASAAGVPALRGEGARGLDAHLQRIVESVDAGDLPPVILVAHTREMQAFRAALQGGGYAGPAPVLVAVEALTDPGDRASLQAAVPLPVERGAVAGLDDARRRARRELGNWIAGRSVHATGRIERILPLDVELLPSGVLYAVAQAPDRETRRRAADRALALWDRWWAETNGSFERSLGTDYGRFLNDAGVELHVQGNVPAARTMFDRARSLDRANPCAWHNLGIACAALGDAACAATAQGRYDALRVRLTRDAEWRDVVRRHGDILSAERRAGIGFRWLGEGDPAQALASFRRALTLDPRHRPARLGMAWAHLGLDSAGEARDALSPLLDADPGDPDALVILAALHRREGEGIEAETVLVRALGREPGHAEALHSLGTLMLERGDVRAALRYLERVTSLDASDNRHLVSLARAQYASREYHRCEATAETILRRDPRDADALILRGLAALGLERTAAALSDLERVAAVLPRHPDVLWAMGEAARQSGDTASMRAWWERFLAETPGDGRAPAVRRALEPAQEPPPRPPGA